MRLTKTHLLGGVALSALALSLASGPAQAFDEVHWKWNAYISEYAKIHVDVDVYNDPTGLVQIEKLQMQIGDVKAESIVHDIENNQPDVDVSYGGYGGHGWGWGHNVDVDAIDAELELPEVLSSATAVGNNQNIESEVAVLLHDGQFTFGGFGYGYNNDIDLPYYGPLSHNTNLAMLGGLLEAGSEGVITPAYISAESKVWDILNATVDSSATAVGNNINVDVGTTDLENQVVMGDITQFAYADLRAKSYVSYVSLNNYDNLAAIQRPIVSSVATAVGNNVNIRVGVPTSE